MGKTLIDIINIIKDLMRDMGFEIALFTAGCIGAMSNSSNQRMTKTQKFLAFISGGAIAMYLTPLVYLHLGINENSKYGVGYLLGFSGMEGVKFLLVKIKSIINKKTGNE